MESSESADWRARHAEWRAAGLRYHRLSFCFRRHFGHRVWKVSVDAGLGCPNVDGTVGTGGCIFCNVRSYSPSRRLSGRSIGEQISGRSPRDAPASGGSRGGLVPSVTEQIEAGIRRLRRRRRVDRFVAYFQPATNTYAPVEQLRRTWEDALRHPEVVGLIVGTRPDCVPDDVLDLLAEFSQKTWLCVEYGLQTIHDRSLDWLGRGHHFDAFLDAVGRSRSRGLRIGAHVILGLPGETRQDMLATARQLARLDIDSVKLHNLYVARETPLAAMWSAGKVELPDRGQYAAWAADFLEELPGDCVVDRLSSDAPPEYLVAPTWCLDKAAVRAAIEAELNRRDTWQGRKCGRCSAAGR